MLNQIHKHPSLCFSQDIADICCPLKQLNINYFAHVNIDQQGRFSAISTHPGFSEHYLKKEYYNADIHLASSSMLEEYILWDAIECTAQTEQMNQEAAELGVKHTFTIVEKNGVEKNFYHFSSNLIGPAINQVYLANIDLLNLFILHFKDKMNDSKILSDAYNMKFSIDPNSQGFTMNPHSHLFYQNNERQEFLSTIQENYISSIIKPLSMRELEVLVWFHYGKTVSDIAQLLNIAEVTVNKHIAKIKEKTQCYTQFQLGEFFSRIHQKIGPAVVKIQKNN